VVDLFAMLLSRKGLDAAHAASWGRASTNNQAATRKDVQARKRMALNAAGGA